MKPSFVLDCSMTMAWFFKDEATAGSDKVFDRLANESAVVPTLWFLEVANVFAVAERRRRISADQTNQFLIQLMKLDLVLDGDSFSRSFDILLPLCRSHQLSSYDAVYLDVALRHGLPLATLDEPLAKVARKLGIKSVKQ